MRGGDDHVLGTGARSSFRPRMGCGTGPAAYTRTAEEPDMWLVSSSLFAASPQ
jgi:hypothetical protein